MSPSFSQVIFTHFVPCFFLGVVSLLVVAFFFPGDTFGQLAADRRFHYFDVGIAIVNGVFVATLVVLFHLHRNYRIRRGKSLYRQPRTTRAIVYGGLVGFIGGAFEITFGMLNEGVVVLTLLVLVILVLHLRAFGKDVVKMLRPGNHATWNEVAELMRIYMTMVAGFTLLNATLEVGHHLAGTPVPFGFGMSDGRFFINSLYFTVVTMTTLGFGDIVPKTWDGKLVLMFQCLASYFMFALTVGIITRGVTRTQDEIENE